MARPGRLIWRILTFPLTRMLISIIAVVAVVVGEGILAQQLGASSGLSRAIWFRTVTGVILVISVCLVYALYVRVFERRPATELSRDRAPLEFALGSAIGFGLFAATIACLWLGGFYHVHSVGLLPSAATLVALGLVPAFMEEIIIRGIVFRITEESLGTWLAILISALLFGVLHLLNPSASWVAALSIALEAGVLLAAAYVTTRRLWLPIGLHFAWNFTQGGIFGVAVSGLSVSGLFKSTLTGPELLSGGAFGAETSLFAVLICTSAAIALLVAAVRNDRIIRPFWSKKRTAAESDSAKDPIDAVAGEQLEDQKPGKIVETQAPS